MVHLIFNIHLISIAGPSTSSGKEFYLGFLENPGSKNYLMISSDKDTAVNIATLLGGPQVVTVPAGQLVTVALRDNMYMHRTQKTKMGIHVTALENITVYGMSQSSYSSESDGFLALPVHVLAYEYIIASYTSDSMVPSPSLVGIVATSDGTRVDIHLKTLGLVSYGGYMYSSGNVITVTMDRMETFQISHSSDLTGTRVVATRPVSVFSGSLSAKVPISVDSSSHLVEQIPPVVTWGKRIIVVPLVTRKGDIVRVIASEDNTNLKISGSFNKSMEIKSSGSFAELDSSSWPPSSSVLIVCSRACLVVQFSKGREADGVPSDPFMMIVPPVEQYTNNYVLSPAVPAINGIITIIVEGQYTETMYLNDRSLDTWYANWTAVSGTRYRFTTLNLGGSASAKIWNSNNWVRFAVLFYGFAQTDNSYGLPGRFALEPINDMIPKIHIQDFYQESCKFVTAQTNTGEPLTKVAPDCSGKRVSYEDRIIKQDFCEHVIERQWKLVDYCKHCVFAVQNIRMIKSKPVITFPGDVAITCDGINNGSATGAPSVSACADNPATVVKTDRLSSPGLCRSAESGTVFRQWNVSDVCGNVREHVQVLTIFTIEPAPAISPEEGKISKLP